MPFKTLLILHRNPSLTPQEFKNHFETVHAPLLRSCAGLHFPLEYRRVYIQRSAATDLSTSSDACPAAVLVGEQADFSFDALVELTFENEKHMQEYVGAMVGHP